MKNTGGDKTLRLVLFLGVGLSLLIMLIGLLFYFVNPQESDMAIPLKELFPNLTRLNPVAVIDLGILILMVTPAIGILGKLFSFIKNRELKFVLVSILLFILLTVSFSLASFQ